MCVSIFFFHYLSVWNDMYDVCCVIVVLYGMRMVMVVANHRDDDDDDDDDFVVFYVWVCFGAIGTIRTIVLVYHTDGKFK